MFLGAIISPFKILLAMFFAYLSAISFPKIPKWLDKTHISHELLYVHNIRRPYNHRDF